MQTHANTSKIKRFFKSKWVTGAMVLIALVAGYYIFHSKSAPYQFITVTQGTITETVSVTGNTTPMKSVSIGFQNSGTIGRTNYNLGDYVNAGAVIAELTTGNLYASLQQAQASLSIAEANLAALTVGTRQEQLVIDQNAVTQAQSALSNAIASAYVASDSAVHVTADQFFTNPRTASAAITFVVPDVELANNLVQKRIELEPALSYWGAQVSSPSFGSSDPMAPATQAVQNLAAVSAFLNDAAAALAKTSPSSSVPAATLATYESNVAAARASIATALTALTSAKTALVTASGTLTLARAGSTAESIAAQRAQVEQARAGVANALANLRGSQIISPISGVVTQQDAKVGQLASPGTPLVSVIGSSGFEIDAGVSETDVGKLAVGNPVTMSLDAFPNETFMGTVFYIAPAQKNTQGVISYQIKISFSKADPRLKSGLTANVDIQTKKKENVLILPQYAILQNDSGTFVETLAGRVSTTSPVRLGIQDQKGNVEIISGVTLGEKVINIGLK